LTSRPSGTGKSGSAGGTGKSGSSSTSRLQMPLDNAQILNNVYSFLRVRPEDVISWVNSLGKILVGIFTVFVVSIYMLLSEKRIYNFVAGWFPQKNQATIFNSFQSIKDNLGKWLQG
jgi:predicted PurR-regulated permease PerM